MPLYPEASVSPLSGGDLIDDVTEAQWQTGINDLLTPTQYTAGIGAAATGFTLSASVMQRAGKWATLDLLLAVTTAITATGGDITDKTCFTLNSDYRPAVDCNFTFGNGVMDGECTVSSSSGIISLRSANASIATSTTIRIHAGYFLA